MIARRCRARAEALGIGLIFGAGCAGCAGSYTPAPHAHAPVHTNEAGSSMEMRDRRLSGSTPQLAQRSPHKSTPVTTQLTQTPTPSSATTSAPATDLVPIPTPVQVQETIPVQETVQEPARLPATLTPVSREPGAIERQQLVLERAKAGHAQVVLIGDSITQGWEGAPDQLQSLVGSHSVVNLGVGGDRTQHVLWRLEQAPLSALKPKVVVMMIGTNNLSHDSADDIVAGIQAVAELIQGQCPDSEILVLDIPPRAEPMDPLRAKAALVNTKLAKRDWPAHARFVRVGDQFVLANGEIDRAIMPDLLHFSPNGYALWANSIKPELECSWAAEHPNPAPATPHP